MEQNKIVIWVVIGIAVLVLMIYAIVYVQTSNLGVRLITSIQRQPQTQPLLNNKINEPLVEISGSKIATSTSNYIVTINGNVYPKISPSEYRSIFNTNFPPIITGIDPLTFIEINAYYSKDKSNVYHGGQILSHTDPITFSVMKNLPHDLENAGFANGSGVIYFSAGEGFIASTTQIDVNSFRFSEKPFNQESQLCCFAKDKLRYYFVTQQKAVYIFPIGKIDEKTFKNVGGPFMKDTTRVFAFFSTYDEEPLSPAEIVGADPATFHMIENLKTDSAGNTYDAEDMAQDKFRTYSLDKLIEDAKTDTSDSGSAALNKRGFMLKYFPILEPQR